jgi:two-component system chemotaxis response regulator CheB
MTHAVASLGTTYRIIAVGASTGGPEALREFLGALPADAPGVLVVQHMPQPFTRAFAERLARLCAVHVKEAQDGDRVLAGCALIAPGDEHMRLAREGASYRVRLTSEARVNRHRPSVDVLFQSCAERAGANAVGVLMTGMGDDGARGLLAMRRAGARTLAQDEQSCVIYGMPKVAVELGAAQQVLALPDLAGAALARRVRERAARDEAGLR